MTRHAHVFPNSTRGGTVADGAVSAVRFRTVRRTLAGEVMFLHHALKTFAFRPADDIDKIASLKLGDAEIDFTFRQISLETKFAHELLRFDVRLLESA